LEPFGAGSAGSSPAGGAQQVQALEVVFAIGALAGGVPALRALTSLLLGPRAPALVVLDGLGRFDELKVVADLCRQRVPYFERCREEELSLKIHVVEPTGSELRLKLTFECDGIVREIYGMHVKRKWYRCVAELTHSFYRIEPPGHTDLDNLTAKRANVAYNVYISGAEIGSPLFILLESRVDLSQALLKFS
jgi:hypothetical protein